MDTKEKPPAGANRQGGLIETSAANPTKPHRVREGTKLRRVLSALANGEKYHRFTAARELNDWCIHSTASSIQRLGITVHRIPVKVPCLGGTKETEVMLYSLLPDEQAKALRILGMDGGSA